MHRLATTIEAEFPDGIRLVELAPLRDPGAVPAAVGDALDVQQRANRSLPDSIVEMLASRHMLLVLDNCEHVLDTTSELVELILRWCPNVQVLATSREPLGIPAEVVWSVPPLPVPADRTDPLANLEENPAVRLFVERARAARHDFELDEANAAAVAEICIRLDGVPLALELAAARMRSMSPEQLAERLPERFRVLAGSRRATDPRHRNLRDLVQWSYELLTEPEQRLFERISIFAGSFDLDRAERVCAGVGIDEADISSLLATLVDKSMVTAERRGPDSRYRQLETLREFGRERLADRPESAAIRNAHAASSRGSRRAGRCRSRRSRRSALGARARRGIRRHAGSARVGDRRRRRRSRASTRRGTARVRVAAHSLRAARVGRRRGCASRVRRITRSIRSRSASSPTACSFGGSSTPRSKPASGPSPRPPASGHPRWDSRSGRWAMPTSTLTVRTRRTRGRIA